MGGRVNSSICPDSAGGLDMQFKALRCRPKSLDTSRDSLFILKHATDFAGEKVH